MTDQDKENLQKKELTESLLIACLATCETVISKNAYLGKKWGNYWTDDLSDYGGYSGQRILWMGYREKIRSLLLPVHSMKLIIQMTKGCTSKATQKAVQDVIKLIDKNDYTLV